MRQAGSGGSLLDLLVREEAKPPRASLLDILPAKSDPLEDVTADPVPIFVREPEPKQPASTEALDRLERALDRARDMQRPEPAPSPPEAIVEPKPAPLLERPYQAPLPVAAPQSRSGTYAALAPAAIVRTLARRWYLIVLGGLLGAGLAAMYSLTLPNEYQAISRIVLEPRGITPIRDTVAPQGLNSEATIAYSQSQVDIIRSISVLGPVVENEDLMNDREFVDRRHWLDKLGFEGLRSALISRNTAPAVQGNVLEEIYERLYVGRLNQSFVIEIGFTSEDPSKAARIANSITRSYLQSESGAQSAAAQSASTDLTSRLQALRERVAASEELIEAHKRKFNLVETNGRLVDEDSLARLNEQLARATAQTAEARSRVELAQSIDVDDVVGGGLPEALQTPTITQARLQYQRARSALSRLSVKLGERHPQLREAAAELTAAEDSITAELKRITEANARELTRSQSREADLLKSVAALRERALESNAPKAQLREFERQLDADRRVYENFLQRSRETGEQTAIASRNARVISEALPPEEKVGPVRTVMTIAGGIVGGSIAAALALLPAIFGAGRTFLGGAPNVPSNRHARARPAVARSEDDLYGDIEPQPLPADPPAAAKPEIAPAPVRKKQTASKKKSNGKKARKGRPETSSAATDSSPRPVRLEQTVPLETPDAGMVEPSDGELNRAYEDGLKAARREASILESARAEADKMRRDSEREAAELRSRTQPVHYPALPMMTPAYPPYPSYAPPPYGYASPPIWPYPPYPAPAPHREDERS